VDIEFDSQSWLKEFAGRIEQLIFEHRPRGISFLRDELDDWINSGKGSVFPIRDNDYGEPIDEKIDIHQASVIIAVIYEIWPQE